MLAVAVRVYVCTISHQYNYPVDDTTIYCRIFKKVIVCYIYTFYLYHIKYYKFSFLPRNQYPLFGVWKLFLKNVETNK